MEKSPNKMVREYAMKWHEIASRIRPPLIEKELVSLFVNTFKASYYDYLLSNGSNNSIDIVFAADRIEQAIKVTRVVDPSELGSKRKISVRRRKWMCINWMIPLIV